MTVVKLFATPVSVLTVPNHVLLNKELFDLTMSFMDENDGTKRSNRGGWHSKNDFFLKQEPCCVTLAQVINAAVKMYLKAQNDKFQSENYQLLANGWINANPRNAFNAPHTHAGAHVSGVYYVNNPTGDSDRSGMIEFLDPRNDVTQSMFSELADSHASYRIKPVAGTLVLFPSYLTHWVYPNEADELRVTIAFNVSVQKK